MERLKTPFFFVSVAAMILVVLLETGSRFLLSTAGVWEEAGARWFQRVSGTVMVEASKQIYQLSRGKKVRARRPVLVPVGAAQPALGVRREGEEQPG